MKQILMLGLMAIAFYACNKNSSTPSLEGIYIEESPIKGGSRMNFLNGSLVVFSEPGTSIADTFKIPNLHASIPEAPIPYMIFKQ